MFHWILLTCWSQTLAGVDSENATLICNMVLGMVDNDNQPLPKNVPLPADEAPNAPQFFSNWEHSGNCYCCLEGGRRNKARLSFNSEVKPTIEQLFEMFFFQEFHPGNYHPPNKSQPTT